MVVTCSRNARSILTCFCRGKSSTTLAIDLQRVVNSLQLYYGSRRRRKNKYSLVFNEKCKGTVCIHKKGKVVMLRINFKFPAYYANSYGNQVAFKGGVANSWPSCFSRQQLAHYRAGNLIWIWKCSERFEKLYQLTNTVFLSEFLQSNNTKYHWKLFFFIYC